MDTLVRTIFGERMVATLQVLSPTAITVAYFFASLVHVLNAKKITVAKENDGEGRSLRAVCQALTALVVGTYVSESVLLACVLPSHAATSSNHNLVFTLFSSLVWLILFLRIMDSSSPDIRPVFSLSWVVALVFDVALLIPDILTPELSGAARTCRLVAQITRVMLLLTLVGVALGECLPRHAEKASDEEIAPLLARIESHLSTSGAHQMNGDVYGATTDDDTKKKGDAKDSSQPEADDQYEDSDDEDEVNAGRGKLKKHWWVYTKAFAIFLPHLWPRKSVRLQLHFPALGLCLLACRALNVLVPLQLGIVIDILRGPGGNVPWAAIGLFVLLGLLDSSAGISLVQSWLWLPINSYTTEELSAAAYDQVMNLSSDFHDSKKSGRMWRIVSRGESLTDLVQTICFEMVPMAADLAIAVSVFWWLFDAYMAFIVALASVLFLWSTAKTMPLRTKRQRDYIKAWEDEYAQMTESSLNWSNVCYFNRIGYEQNRYKEAVRNSQHKLIRYRGLSFFVSGLRVLTLQVGLLAATMLAAYQISKGDRKVGDFVVLITYWAQLSGPLSFFANGFSRIAISLVDAEKLLELLQTKPTVANHPGATDLVLKQGQVDFDRVCFSYDGKRQVAKNISFRAEPGQTIALVGETGGGKSTILKLLFRFYDATSGNVMIDGQDVRLVTLESLRANIGCVPQDPVLFNQTILQNLRYAKLDASEEEVQAACKAVALHDKIMSFTKGYSEKVGERGVKLSGGELQRMAIAQAILKDPKILLLDEATSSVDSETEALIQSSLRKLCAGRTTFVIAHRLSTIVHADLIMVINGGSVIERGTHDKLMRVGGHYSRLWTRQLRLQTGEEGPRSRSRSPEKKQALDSDVPDGEMESCHVFRKGTTHRKGRAEQGHVSSIQASDGEKAMEPTVDAKEGGPSPRRDETAWDKFDPIRRRVQNSKTPRCRAENALQERRSRSHSPTRPSLKPDAPEFVPAQILQNETPYLSVPACKTQTVDEPPWPRSHVSPCQTASDGCLPYATAAQKENISSSSDPSMSRPASATPVLAGEKITRLRFRVPDGQGRKETCNANTSVERPASEGRPQQDVSEPGQMRRKRHERKPRFGKQIFNSRRSISKSEPQGRNKMASDKEQEVDCMFGMSPAPRRCGQGEMLTRRRSSAPEEAVSSRKVVHQAKYCGPPGSSGSTADPEAGAGAVQACNMRSSQATSTASTDGGGEETSAGPTDSLAMESKPGSRS